MAVAVQAATELRQIIIMGITQTLQQGWRLLQSRHKLKPRVQLNATHGNAIEGIQCSLRQDCNSSLAQQAAGSHVSSTLTV